MIFSSVFFRFFSRKFQKNNEWVSKIRLWQTSGESGEFPLAPQKNKKIHEKSPPLLPEKIAKLRFCHFMERQVTNG